MLNIYRASAGSGKTYRLTQDYIHLLFDPTRDHVHRRILAVTFTNKATDEMKTRILHELYALASHAESDYRNQLVKRFLLSAESVDEKALRILIQILHDYSAFQISTIDKFFQQVIRAFARDIGVHGGYNLQLDTDETLSQAVDNLFLELSDKENEQLLKWLTKYAEDRIENSESWDTHESIYALGKEIFKESYQYKAEETNRKLHDREFLSEYRTKLRNIQSEYDDKVKALVANITDLISSVGLTTDSFKGGTRSAMNWIGKFAEGKYELKDTFVAMGETVENCYAKSTPKDTVAAIERIYHSGLQQGIQQLTEWLRNDIVRYNSAGIILKHINTLGILTDLAMQIRKLTSEQNTMLLSDTNMLLNRIIDESDTPFVYEKTGIHIDNYMIDEFQDTSVLQWKNFFPLIDNSLSSDKFNLVVGDVKQSIYRWRNSDWKLLDEQVLTDFRPEQIHEEELDTNWRSDRYIVELNNSFFRMGAWLLQKKMNNDLNEVLPVYPRLESLTRKIEHAYSNVAQKTKPKAGEGYVKFEFIATDDTEEKWVQKSLLRLPAILEDIQERGYQPSDVGILVKTNREAMSVTRTLLSYKTTEAAREGFVYDVMGNEGLQIAGSHAVRFIMGLLRLFVHPTDVLQSTIVRYEYARAEMKMTGNEALNLCFDGIGNDLAGLMGADRHAGLMALRNVSLFGMTEGIIALFDIGNWPGEAVFVQAFQDVVFKFSTNRSVDLYSFLKWWDKNGDKQCISSPDQQNAFRVMTIHKSKGLDFKVVVMPFCEWDFEKSSRGNIRNILWCETQEAPFNELSLLPVEYNKTLGKSIFAENYYNEQMHQFIDNLNVAYVAFTRARHELICMLPAPKKEPESENDLKSLSSLIYFSLSHPELQPAEIPCVQTAELVFEAGKALWSNTKPARKKGEKANISVYPTAGTEGRLRIRHFGENYFEGEGEITDNRLNYGILMHEILNMIREKSDQEKAVLRMISEGRIDSHDALQIRTDLEKFWQMPGVENWFGPDLQIMNEVTILTPGGNVYRPDRVIIKGKKATVVDYKFGKREKEAYIEQLKEYQELIKSMGYETDGYLCYISLGKVTKL
ncbi:MAG: UvrD-helicase domain-containing protein [Paludibacteraceae bacterium]|nr:UvrD-helicase domain-containing protein [Paludibacteraceae bacterium]